MPGVNRRKSQVPVPACRRSTPEVMFGRYPTVAFNGCRSVRVPDTLRNRGWLGKMNAALGGDRLPGDPADDVVRDRARHLTRIGLKR